MTKSLLTAFFVLGMVAAAFAQEQQQAAPEVRALSMRARAEFEGNISCTAAAFDLQDKLKAAQEEVKRLTEKYEPKPKDTEK